ncbi:CvpA family protein [Methylibium sp.]|uniref:CvpA family protein n=1 Tax=Methylibium sp. TaxID=2067992 RepID=UPI0025FF4AAB|nr:CvpA family protein [Methylibium sp.]
MSWIDWAFLSVVVLSVVVGVVRGLMYEVMSLLGWVLAYVAAHAFGRVLAPAIPVGSPGSGLNLAVSFAAVFIGTLIVWNLLSWLLKKLVQASPLNPLDRVLGAVFGLLRGGLIGLAVATAVNLTPLAESATWRGSHSAAGLREVLSGLRPLLPDEVARHLPA